MKDSSRSLRRHHIRRVRRNRASDINNDHSRYDHVLNIRTHTACTCSCWMCGNPRKYFNQKTIQEKSAEEIYKKDINELPSFEYIKNKFAIN